jgi:hypothetical protein
MKMQSIPCVEFSVDKGHTWNVWCLYRSSQLDEARACKLRCESNMPEFLFRVSAEASVTNEAAKRTFMAATRQDSLVSCPVCGSVIKL